MIIFNDNCTLLHNNIKIFFYNPGGAWGVVGGAFKKKKNARRTTRHATRDERRERAACGWVSFFTFVFLRGHIL